MSRQKQRIDDDGPKETHSIHVQRGSEKEAVLPLRLQIHHTYLSWDDITIEPPSAWRILTKLNTM